MFAILFAILCDVTIPEYYNTILLEPPLLKMELIKVY